MNKKRLTFLAILMVALIVLTTGMLVACDKHNPGEPEEKPLEATEGLLIGNSDFKVIGTTGDYPRSITDWTGGRLYSSGSYADNVTAGAVSLIESLYNANRDKWNDDGSEIAEGSGTSLYEALKKDHYSEAEGAVNNVMMIYMPTEAEESKDSDDYGPTAYGYTSKSFNLEKASYYKLTVDVLTHKIAGTDKDDNVPGARIYLSSNAYAEFSGIDTKGEWKTYTIYIESPSTAASSLTLNLSLGKYSSSYTKGLTTGYAFFDNVELTKLETDQNVSPREQFVIQQELEKEDNSTLQTVTMLVPNGRFDFGTTAISSNAAANNWSVVAGNSQNDDDSAPTSLGYNGIIDVSQFNDNYQKYAGTFYKPNPNGGDNVSTSPTSLLALNNVAEIISAFPDDRIGNNVYMLSQQLMTAQGLKSGKKITIEKNKFYALSISLYTFNINGAGVTLTLSGDGKDISLKGISKNPSAGYPDGTGETAGTTNGGWTTYTFYIQGNPYRDMSYNMTLWLGTGGKSDNTEVTYTKYTSSGSTQATTYLANGTFSTGWAFFDELTLDVIDGTDYTDAQAAVPAPGKFEAEADDTNAIKVDLTPDNLFDDTVISSDFSSVSPPSSDSYDKGTLGTPVGFSEDIDRTKEDLPVITPQNVTAGVVDISEGSDFTEFGIDNPLSPYTLPVSRALMMLARSDSYYAMKTEPFTINANSFYRLSMWVKTADIRKTSGIYVYLMDSEDETKSSFTVINTDEYDDYTNDWVELTFLIRGAKSGSNEVYLRFTLGDGTRWTTSTLARGAAFVTNMSLTSMTYSDYTGASESTYVKKADFSTSVSNSFTNGSFDNFNVEKTEGMTASGELEQKAAVPENWALSDNTLGDDFVGGIIKLDEDENTGKFSGSAQTQALFGNNYANLFNNLYTDEDYAAITAVGGPSMLALAGLNGAKFSAGYTSDSFSLSSGTNYTIELWVKAVGADTRGMIYLTGEAAGTEVFDRETYIVIQGSDNPVWQKYTFNIQVGLTSVSLKLGLWLGQNETFVELENEEDAKSGGLILFDSVTKNSKLSDDEFDALAEEENSRKITFFADSFGSVSSSVEDRSKLTSPSGWTGSVGTNQDKDNTKSGVIYADSERLAVDEDGYITILGPELDVDDMEISQSELDEAKESGNYEGMSDTEITEALKELKLAEEKAKRMMSLENLVPFDGKRMLIINNTADSAYVYTSSSYTFKSENVYKVSVYIRTYGIDAEKGAYAEVYLGSANEADKPLRFELVNSDQWVRYEFYIKTLDDDVTSVSIKLGLGIYDADDESKLVSGYAMFDRVEIQTVDDKVFDDLLEDSKLENPTIFNPDTMLLRQVTEKPQEGNTGNEETPPETPDTAFDLNNLWWMIPTILLGLAIIAVVVAFFVKKVKKPKKSAGGEDADSAEVIARKKDKYDSFNE